MHVASSSTANHRRPLTFIRRGDGGANRNAISKDALIECVQKSRPLSIFRHRSQSSPAAAVYRQCYCLVAAAGLKATGELLRLWSQRKGSARARYWELQRSGGGGSGNGASGDLASLTGLSLSNLCWLNISRLPWRHTVRSTMAVLDCVLWDSAHK